MFEKNFITSDELREMRLKEHRIRREENLLIDDRLESGYLGIYEYIGGCLYLEPQFLEDLLIAGIEIIKSDEKEVKLNSIFCKFGHEEMVPLMVKQIKHFADFYGYDFFRFEEKEIKKIITEK